MLVFLYGMSCRLSESVPEAIVQFAHPSPVKVAFVGQLMVLFRGRFIDGGCMKKISLWVGLFTLITAFAGGCGFVYDVDEAQEEGNDWRTTREFIYLDWNTPYEKSTLMAGVYEDYDVVILASDQEKYIPYPDCKLPDGINDVEYVKDNMYMKDFNNDGYDDLCLKDRKSGTEVNGVFVYSPYNKSFDYSDEYSASEGSQQGEEKEKAADIGKFVGEWYVDGSLSNGHIEIEENGNVTAYSYEGTVNYEGKLQCEEYENPDGSTDVIYNVYDGNEIVFGFYEPEEEDFYEFYTGQDSEIHYVRKDHCTEDE